MLREDGFGSKLELVDAWKEDSHNLTYYQFAWKTDKGSALVAAGEEGLRAFFALHLCVWLLDRPETVPAHEIEAFRTHSLEKHQVGISQSVKWPVFKAFLWRLAQNESKLCFKQLQVNLVSDQSMTGACQLFSFLLGDGVYLAAAYTVVGVGHTFALRVTGSSRVVSDYLGVFDDIAAWNEKPLQDVEWIHNIAFIRKVEFIDN